MDWPEDGDRPWPEERYNGVPAYADDYSDDDGGSFVSPGLRDCSRIVGALLLRHVQFVW